MTACRNGCGESVRRTTEADRVDPGEFPWVHESGNPVCDGMFTAGPMPEPEPHDAQAAVRAVIDVLAPLVDGPPEWGPQRWPIFRLDYDGQMVMPTDDQVRALAESVVTAIRTASGPVKVRATLSKACGCEWLLTGACERHAPEDSDPYENM